VGKLHNEPQIFSKIIKSGMYGAPDPILTERIRLIGLNDEGNVNKDRVGNSPDPQNGNRQSPSQPNILDYRSNSATELALKCRILQVSHRFT